MARPWEADSSADFKQRWGKSPQELGNTSGDPSCPDIWELSNGDIAMIGRKATSAYVGRLPKGVSVGADEEIVILPRNMLIAAKADIPDV